MKGGEGVLKTEVMNNVKQAMDKVANKKGKVSNANSSNDFASTFEKLKSKLDQNASVNAKDSTRNDCNISKNKNSDSKDKIKDRVAEDIGEALGILNSISQMIITLKESTAKFTVEDLESLHAKLNGLLDLVSNSLSKEQQYSLGENELNRIKELVAFMMASIDELETTSGEGLLDSRFQVALNQLENKITQYISSLDMHQIVVDESDINEHNTANILKSAGNHLGQDLQLVNNGLVTEKQLEDKDKQQVDNKFAMNNNLVNIESITSNQVIEANEYGQASTQELYSSSSDSQVSKDDILGQIVDKLRLNLDDNKQEIEIKLKPDVLGKLMLKMELRDGVLTAKMLVDNIRTKELIESNLLQLKEQIEDNGLDIKTFEVHVGTNEDFEKQQNHNFNFKSRPNKKLKIRDSIIEGTQMYDEGLVQGSVINYHEGKLNLFA